MLPLVRTRGRRGQIYLRRTWRGGLSALRLVAHRGCGSRRGTGFRSRIYKMASPDRSKRKILKAKKTMPTSCRKQAEILNNSKTVEVLKTTIENNVPSVNQNLSIRVRTGECRHPEIVDSSLDSKKNSAFLLKSTGFPQNLIKPVEKIVHSETRFEHTGEQVSSYKKPRKTIDSPSRFFIQEVKEKRNSSEAHFEYKTNVTSSFFQHEQNCNLKSSCHSPMSDVVQNALDDNRINKVASSLEADSNDERQNDILSSNSCCVPVAKMPNSVNVVSSSNCVANTWKTKESSRTQCSSISDCENTDSKWQCLLNTDGYNQKKKMFSENKENFKRMKTSEQINENICVALERQTAVLEQVKHLIQQEMFSANFKVFDKKLKELNERIGKTQCRNKHEAIACELLEKISKLHRRVKTVLVFQRKCLEANTFSSNTPYKIGNLETTIMNKNQELINRQNEKMTSMNCESSNSSKKASEKVNLSSDCVEFVSESNNDDVILISVESSNLTTPITSNPTGISTAPSTNSRKSPDDIIDIRAPEKKKSDFVIDLTNENLSYCNTESPVFTLESPSKAVLNSKEITPVAENATEDLDSFEHLPPLPEPLPPPPELVDRVGDTLPPQKPELKVKWVLRPMGIALTWNITKVDPKCAPVESYHLFLCHENTNNKLIWKKIGEIKALPLPMACTLSEFFASTRYYFTVQSKDIFGRYGPFCDIKSLPGFSDNFT
ncbi:activating transcription factor 7-interacting protein 2 isoform X1 [Fukomys damarensis]|uniref:activating transcription factor 7-interacting protein 2 isoform X1 n=1 Tax=Fukomys damarensis TaxID=885580 RepID=UPI0014559597|nr:activating transcription factor 7-interacting protein 2 isoform X1 [Fukomys damarensis]